MNKAVKRVIAVAVAAAVVCGGVYGGLNLYKRTNATAVNVYAVGAIAYSSYDFYMDDGSTAYGTVSLDGIQNVYVSSPTTVKEVNVVEGDSVKKGDVLVTYDTTQLDIEVAKAENDLAQKQLDLKFAQEDLEIANRLSPSSGTSGGDGSADDGSGGDDGTSDTDSGTTDDTELSAEDTPVRLSGSGTSADPYIYLWSTNDALTDDVLLHMFQPDGYDESTGTVASTSTASFISGDAVSGLVGGLLKSAGILPVTVYGEEGSEEPDIQATENPVTSGTVESAEEETETPGTTDGSSTGSSGGASSGSAEVETGTEDIDDTESTQSSESAQTYDETGSVSGVNLTGCPNEVYVVLEIHQNDNREGTLLKKYGMHLVRVGQDAAVKLYDPDASSESTETDSGETSVSSDDDETGDAGDYLDDGDLSDEGGEGTPDISGDDTSDANDSSTTERVDPNASYTAEEIADLKKSKTKEVRDLTIDVRQAEIVLKQQKEAAEDGTTKAQFDGIVVSAEDAGLAYENGEPCVKVSAGGGYRIPISVSELEVPNLSIGDEVTVTSAYYDEGSMEYTGTIRSISTYPASSGESDYYGSGNPNSSYYPCVVYVDGDEAMLNEYDYVEVKYGSDANKETMILEKAFVRSDAGGSYVYKEGDDGKLVKTYIKTGTGIEGYYVTVESGIDWDEDYLAFPYGSDVVEGAPVSEHEDTDALYA